MALPPDPLNRKPWPMKWVVVAIIACIVPYTWLTLAYRKESPAHQPYQDNKDRAQVLRLLNSGFHRFEADLEILSAPATPPVRAAEVTFIDGGVPPLLHELLIDPPAVPERLASVIAPDAAPSGAPYAIAFVGPLPYTDERPAKATVYHRDQELVFIVTCPDLPQNSLAHRGDVTTRLTMSTHHLAPGTYHATLVGVETSLRWTLEIH